MQDRTTFIGGSDATRIAQGKLKKVWRLKRGIDPEPDLSNILRVQMGIATEPFNRAWYTKQTGIEVERVDPDKLYAHPTFGFLACHPDGFVVRDGVRCVWDAKHVSADTTIEEKAVYYQAQLTHNALACGVDGAELSVFFGNAGWARFSMTIDRAFAGELMAREDYLWECVTLGNEPDDMDPIGLPAPKPAHMRAVDMKDSNVWAVQAASWLANRDAAKAFKEAEKELKALVADDVGHAYGHGIEIKRNRAGSLSIKEVKQKVA